MMCTHVPNITLKSSTQLLYRMPREQLDGNCKFSSYIKCKGFLQLGRICHGPPGDGICSLNIMILLSWQRVDKTVLFSIFSQPLLM